MTPFRALIALLAVLFVAACARDVQVTPRPVDESQIYILRPVTQDATAKQWLDLLTEKWPEARLVPADAWASNLEHIRAQRGIAVLPEARAIPHSYQAVIAHHIDAGGRVLFVGADAFAKPAVQHDQVWQPYETWRETMLAQAEDVSGFSSIQVWQHQQTDGAAHSAVRVGAGRGLPWPAVDVEVIDLQQWDRMRWPDPAPLFEADEYGGMVAYVRGDRQTTRLVLQAEESDGAVWVRDVPLTTAWRPVWLDLSDWSYLHGGVDRGGPDDRLRLEQLSAVHVGLDQQLAPQAAGEHRYGVSDIRLVPMASMPDHETIATLPFIAQSTSRFHEKTRTVRSRRSRAVYYTRASSADYIRGEPLLWSDTIPARWVNLATGEQRAEESQGVLAGLFVQHPDNAPSQTWGWIGLDRTRSTRAALNGLLNEAVFFLQRGRFLTDVQIEQRFFRSDELIRLQARAFSFSEVPIPVRLSGELVDEEDRVVRRVVSAPFELGADAYELVHPLNLGVAPRVEEGIRHYRVQLNLEEVGGQARLFDRVVWPIKVKSEQHQVERLHDRVTIAGGRIMAGRTPIHHLGVDYHPGSSIYPDTRWLNASVFPADQVLTDMQDIAAAGFNTVIVDYDDPAVAPQVRYVIEAATQRGLWIKLRIPFGIPGASATPPVPTLLKALDLHPDYPLAALDLKPPEKIDAEWLNHRWHQWLNNHFSDPHSLLDEWQVSASYFPTPPEWDTWPSEHPIWNVFRRFAHDTWSAIWSDTLQTIRQAGYRQLVTTRWDADQSDFDATMGRSLPFDAKFLAPFIDYLSVVPPRVFSDPQSMGDALFRGLYARGVTASRPIIWAGAVFPLGADPTPMDEAWQSEALQAYHNLVFETRSAGGHVGAYRATADRVLDFDQGLLSASGAHRPAWQTMRSVANLARAYRLNPLEWTGREFSLPEGRYGWRATASNWSDIYVREFDGGRVEEIRPLGYGVWSTEVTRERLSALSDGPFRNMNHQWGTIRVDREPVHWVPGEPLEVRVRQTVQLEFLNTGIARWAAGEIGVRGTVWLEIERPGRTAQRLQIENVAPSGRFRMDWQPLDPGIYTLRPDWQGVGPFGQALTIIASP